MHTAPGAAGNKARKRPGYAASRESGGAARITLCRGGARHDTPCVNQVDVEAKRNEIPMFALAAGLARQGWRHGGTAGGRGSGG